MNAIAKGEEPPKARPGRLARKRPRQDGPAADASAGTHGDLNAEDDKRHSK